MTHSPPSAAHSAACQKKDVRVCAPMPSWAEQQAVVHVQFLCLVTTMINQPWAGGQEFTVHCVNQTGSQLLELEEHLLLSQHGTGTKFWWKWRR